MFVYATLGNGDRSDSNSISEICLVTQENVTDIVTMPPSPKGRPPKHGSLARAPFINYIRYGGGKQIRVRGGCTYLIF